MSVKSEKRGRDQLGDERDSTKRLKGKVSISDQPIEFQNSAESLNTQPNGATQANGNDEEDDEDEESGSSDESDDSDASDESIEDEDDEDDPDKREMSKHEQFQLQAKYRKLDRDLIQQRTEIARENGVSIVAKSLNRADELFSETKTSIQSNIVAKDSATLKEIGLQAKLATKNMKLGRSERNLDFNEFASNFVNFFTTSNERGYADTFNEGDELVSDRNFTGYNWLKAGLLYMDCSARAPTTEFLLGPLEITKKPRNMRQRLKDDSKNGTTKTASRKTASEIMDQDKQDDTTTNSEKCFRKLKTLNLEKINLFKFFIDPNSFAKSVENLFYTSFLINHGKVILGKGPNGLPYVQEANGDTISDLPRYLNKDDSKSHIIFNLDHSTWRNLIEHYNITESFLADR